MKTGVLTRLATLAGMLLFPAMPQAYGAGEPNVTFTRAEVPTVKAEVRYFTGTSVYVEGMVGDRWVGRTWSTDGQVDPNKYWESPAFEIRSVEGDVTNFSSGRDKAAILPGQFAVTGWAFVSAGELAKNERGARHYVVELTNKKHALGVKVHTLLDGTPILVRWLEIKNLANNPKAITALAPWAGRLWSGNPAVALGHSIRAELYWEGWFGWDSLAPGHNVYSNHTDLLWDDPYFIARNETNGEYFFGQLAWPANYDLEFQCDPDGVSFKLGPWASKALRVFLPGETITTPAIHLGCVPEDFDACVQAMHEHIRKSVLPTYPPERAYRIQYMNHEARLAPDDETNNLNCAPVAAAIGMELYLLDGPEWATAYGEWLTPHPKRFPHGLQPLMDLARQKGMLWGLYAEPEGGRDTTHWSVPRDAPKNPDILAGWLDSLVYHEHPDWFSPPMTLNLSIPEAEAYMEELMVKIIETYKLDLYRHDQCGQVLFPPGPGGGQTNREGDLVESDFWRHTEAFNRIYRHIHEKYPNLILQSAAGGNCRLDLGTVGVFHEQFTSDRASMPHVYRMLAGLSVFLPPETYVNANGMAGRDRLPDPDTTLRGVYALGNTPMIDSSFLPHRIADLTPEFRDKCLHYANLYKQFIRPLLATCKVYHHAPVNAHGGVESGNWFAMEFTSPDKTQGWATIIRITKETQGGYLLRLKGLDRRKQYRVTSDNTGKSEVVAGDKLMDEGLKIEPPAGAHSELLLFECE